MYDGEPEYWIIIKETGKRTEMQSHEKIHSKQSKAHLGSACSSIPA